MATGSIARRLARSARILDDASGAQLLQTALATPATALIAARRLLAGRPSPSDASYAHQTVAIVLREGGDTATALLELRSALRAARRVDSDVREADVRATLGLTLVRAGRASAGLAELDHAVRLANGAPLARIWLRRATALGILGRHDEALEELHRALVVSRRSGDVLWQARILNNRGFTHLLVGALRQAAADAAAAERLFDELGETLESARACHNRGVITARGGDIPAALGLFELARRRYEDAGFLEPELVIDTGHALLAAGLATEAVDAAVDALANGRRQAVHQAELLLFAATAALADGQLDRAQDWAGKAYRLFGSQQRPTWRARAQLLRCQARFASGERTSRLQAVLGEVACALEAASSAEALTAHLLAGRVARYRRDDVAAGVHLAAAAGHRRRGAPLTRATGWLAAALQVADDERDRALLLACGRGLDALDEHRNVFGAAEYRATATSHGRDLAELAVDAVTTRGAPRAILLWSERWRATALNQTHTREPHETVDERRAEHLPDAPGSDRTPTPSGSRPGSTPDPLARSKADLMARLQVPGTAGSRVRLDLGRLLTRLGTTQLVALVPSRGMLHAVVVAGGRCTRHVVGPVMVAERELEFARFELQRVARGSGVARPSLRWRQMLQEAVLGPVARRLGDTPVVVVPPASLHAVPWALLPALSQRSVSVAPSASSWLRAAEADDGPRSARGVLLVLGPGLQAGAAEVAQLARVHPSASVLGADAGGPPSDVDAVLAGLDGMRLAHIAAHGSFRADSPLFSSLALDDGPLFVHDLERVRRLPHRVVLSACDTGVAAPVGADELLGLVSSLLRLGTVGVLASVVPVNDEASAPFMVAVHQALAAGRPLTEAALAGRTAAGDDPLAVATAGSFSVWGV